MKNKLLMTGMSLLCAAAILLLSCDGNMTLNERVSQNGDSVGTGELKADFNVSYICCGPTTGTGKFIDEAEVVFQNKSTGPIESYEWGVSNQLFSTAANPPNQVISLNNSWPVNNRTFWLKITGTDGETDYLEKTVTFPILMPVGTVTIDGTSYTIQPRDTTDILPSWPGIIPDWIFYDGTTVNGDWDFLGITTQLSTGMTGAPFPLLIRIGMNGLTSLLGDLRQHSQFSPNVNKRFYMQGGGYSTFDDLNGTFSNGHVFLSGAPTAIDTVIDEIYVEAVMRNPSGQEVNVKVTLNYIAHWCHYDYLFCDQLN